MNKLSPSFATLKKHRIRQEALGSKIMNLIERFLADVPKKEKVVFKAKDVLIKQGESIPYVYVLEKGVCERLEYQENGKVLIYTAKYAYDISEMGAILGAIMLWQKNFVSFCEFRALTDVVCYKVEAQTAYNIMKRDPELLDALLHVFTNSEHVLRQKLYAKGSGNTVMYLCRLLLALSFEKEGRHHIALQETYAHLAARIGVHTVTVSKIMARLQKEGVLSKKHEGIINILDIDALNEYADGQTMHYST